VLFTLLLIPGNPSEVSISRSIDFESGTGASGSTLGAGVDDCDLGGGKIPIEYNPDTSLHTLRGK